MPLVNESVLRRVAQLTSILGFSAEEKVSKTMSSGPNPVIIFFVSKGPVLGIELHDTSNIPTKKLNKIIRFIVFYL